jgi:uncharacterized HhH-GPD family protein
MSDDPLIDAVSEAVERAPEVVVLRAHLAQLLVDECRYAEAVTHCGVCMRQDPSNQLAVQLLERCIVALKGQARWTEAKQAGSESRRAPMVSEDQQPTTILSAVGHSAAASAGPAHRYSVLETPAPVKTSTVARKHHTFESLAADIDELIGSLHPSSAASRLSSEPSTAASTNEIHALARSRRLVSALVDFAESGMDDITLDLPSFTSSPAADRLLLANPFAFLVGVLFDQSIRVDRAWRAPYDLQGRLGHLDPQQIVDNPDAVKRAITSPPTLHHFGENMASWIVAAAMIVCDRYGGDASAIWHGNPTAREVQDRLEQIPGISHAKAAMAVQMLCRDCDVPIRDVPGVDAAYDVNVRRVLLRTGLAYVDELDHMRTVVRASDPTSGAGIALPAWQVGRTWCRPKHPRCDSCPLTNVCARLVDPAPPEATRDQAKGQTTFAQWADGNCA